MTMIMRFETSTGKFVTAQNLAEAAAMAAQYGMGEIVASAPAAKPAKRAPAMSVAKAVCIFAQAQEWPQCGQDWPIDARQRAAQAVIAANPGCTDDLW